MIFNSAYSTRATNGYQLAKMQQAIEQAQYFSTESGLVVERIFPEGMKDVFKIDASANEVNSVVIPAFAHPVEFKGDGPSHKFVVDLRAFTRIDMATRSVKTTDHNGFSFATYYAQFAKAFAEDNLRAYLRDLSGLTINAYASWISENVSRRFSLDGATQYRVFILAGIFFRSLFEEASEFSDQTKNMIAMYVTRELGVKGNDVYDIMDNIGELKGIEDFCGAVVSLSENVRLQDFNVGLLFTILGGTWSGYNAREIACVALEYPPAFFNMVTFAINNRSVGQSAFAKMVQRKGKRELNEWVPKLRHIFQ